MPRQFLGSLAATSAFAILSAAAFAQSPVPRPSPSAGSIVAAKGGEELRFPRETAWRAALVRQDLLGGDILRTNAIGNLAILFADETQIRVGRNSTLLVKEVAQDGGQTQLELGAGSLWARAARGGSGVEVKTPAAVAAIRGTDWSLSVDGSGKTSLVVLEGVVELRNAKGAVTVRQGEGAVAAIGQAPTKFVLVSPQRPRADALLSRHCATRSCRCRRRPSTGPALRAGTGPDRGPGARKARGDGLAQPCRDRPFPRRTGGRRRRRSPRRGAIGSIESLSARADLVEALLVAAARRWGGGRRPCSAGPSAASIPGAGYRPPTAATSRRPSPIRHGRKERPSFGAGDPTAALAHAFVTGFREDLAAAAASWSCREALSPRRTHRRLLGATRPCARPPRRRCAGPSTGPAPSTRRTRRSSTRAPWAAPRSTATSRVPSPSSSRRRTSRRDKPDLERHRPPGIGQGRAHRGRGSVPPRDRRRSRRPGRLRQSRDPAPRSRAASRRRAR